MKNYKNENQQTNLVLVPVQVLDEIKDLIQELKSQKSENQKPFFAFGEFISELDARKILGRKTTWFYEQRRSGRLPFSKVGSKVFYKQQDIQNLLANK